MSHILQFLSTLLINHDLSGTITAFGEGSAFYYWDLHQIEIVVIHTSVLYDIERIVGITFDVDHVSIGVIPRYRHRRGRGTALHIRHSPDFRQALVTLVTINAIHHQKSHILIVITRIDEQHHQILIIHHEEEAEEQARDDELDAQQGEFPSVTILIISTKGDGNRYLVV